MKKPLLIIILAFVIIMLTLVGMMINNNSIIAQVKKDNKQYEIYLGKTILGTDVATLMNRVTEQNKKKNLPKDEKGLYIDNGEDSIRVDIKMTTVDMTYPMETFIDNDIIFFIKNFNLVDFKCTTIEYHKKTGRVSKIVFEEIAELEDTEDFEEE